MKRWNVRYGPDGEVWEVRPGFSEFISSPQSTLIKTQVQGATFHCSAIDELGAVARFMEAWKHGRRSKPNDVPSMR